MNELNKVYKAVLKSWHTEIKDNKKLVLSLDGTEFPIRLDDQDIFLPTEDLLDQNTNGVVFFHPACESIISKETDIFKIIRRIVGFSLLVDFKKFTPVLFDVANKKSKKTMRNAVVEVMEKLKACKTNTRKEVASIMESIEVEINQEKEIDARFIHFDIKRGGRSKLTRDKLYYSCKPTFPFYNELSKRIARTEGQADNRTVALFGKEYSRGALVIAEEIFRFVIPGVDDPALYEQEQMNAEAARFCVLVNTFGAIASDFNSCQSMFRHDFDKAGVYEIDLSYLTDIESIENFYRQIPPLPYNTQSQKEPESNNSSLINQMSNFTSQPTSGYTEVTTGAINHQTMSSNDNTGHVNEVKAMLMPHEVWLSCRKDPATGKFIHTIQAPDGYAMINMSAAGNFLSKEKMGGMMPGMMGGMMDPNTMQQQMLQQFYLNQMMGGGNQATGNFGYATAPTSVTPSNTTSLLQTY